MEVLAEKRKKKPWKFHDTATVLYMSVFMDGKHYYYLHIYVFKYEYATQSACG